MEKDLIGVELSVEKNEALSAHLVFRNKSEKNVFLNIQVTYYDGRVRNNYFEIENSKGDSIDYLGIMSNCTRLPDEYIPVGPGEEIRSTVSLKEFYEITKGENYIIRYYAFNPSFKQQQQGLMEMQSNEVEISY